MLAGIWALIKGLKSSINTYRWFVIAGCLMGLSFMSKGPVSFYALLLPFLLSYGLSYGWQEFRLKYRQVILLLVICLTISAWWPLYTYFQVPEELLKNFNTETASWVNRRVRPIWHYWSFPIQSGLWAIFIVVSLFPSYAKIRVTSVAGNYKFMFYWVVFTILLLALIPEKKERYLMPGLISQSYLVAHLLYYFLINGNLTKADRLIWVTNGLLLALGCLGLLIWINFISPTDLIEPPGSWALTVALALPAATIAYSALSSKIILGIYTIVTTSAVLIIAGPDVINQLNAAEQSATTLRPKDLNGLGAYNYYSLGSLRPEEIWELGRAVKPIERDQLNQIDQTVIIFSDHRSNLDISFDQSEYLGVYRHYSNKETYWDVWLWRPNM